jgi:uncharacterized membrane protein YoaK (UPF0700 family)
MNFDLAELMNNPAAFTAAIVAFTAFIRKNFIPSLDGKMVILFSIIVALGLRFLVPLVPDGIPDAVIGTILLAIAGAGTIDAVKATGVSISKTSKAVQPELDEQTAQTNP